MKDLIEQVHQSFEASNRRIEQLAEECEDLAEEVDQWRAAHHEMAIERDRLAAAIAALYKMADQGAPSWIVRTLCENALPALAAEGESDDAPI